jgi:hypothetical protein
MSGPIWTTGSKVGFETWNVGHGVALVCRNESRNFIFRMYTLRSFIIRSLSCPMLSFSTTANTNDGPSASKIFSSSDNGRSE